MNKVNELRWKKTRVLNDENSFICLVDAMGDDAGIVRAARTSFGKDDENPKADPNCPMCKGSGKDTTYLGSLAGACCDCKWIPGLTEKDRKLIRHLMSHKHTSPFEMVEFIFLVQVPMDCWRQWVRHRTASINEHSTRYTEALDCFQVTDPTEWRLQSTNNKQGSSGFLTEWPDKWKTDEPDTFHPPQHPINTSSSNCRTPGRYLSTMEADLHDHAREVYKERLEAGVAREQARKDLPLSTYTRAYWKCDLHNIFNFLRLRMAPDAQLEIRLYANAMYDIVKQVCPIACEAFEDYVLHAKTFSRMEMEILHKLVHHNHAYSLEGTPRETTYKIGREYTDMTDREWKEFLAKLS